MRVKRCKPGTRPGEARDERKVKEKKDIVIHHGGEVWAQQRKFLQSANLEEP